VYPSLCLAYLGQGARLVVDGADVLPNMFYLTIPGRHNGPLFWVQYVFAILATLIASQAMITATFSLVQQLLNMKCLPSYELFLHGIWLSSRLLFRLHMVHTSEKIMGQIYIPIANWIRESRSVQRLTILKLVSSYDSNYCHGRCFQQLN
jgi:KUP system potassium uptake protein